MTTDRAFCASLGHSPRNIYPHPTNTNLTLEVCLRCKTWLERSRITGTEWPIPVIGMGMADVRKALVG